MVFENLKKYDVILASASPRRHSLLKDLGLKFRVEVRPVVESYPPELQGKDIALHLCSLKADAFGSDFLNGKSLLITADTIVCLEGEVLGKPENRKIALDTLSLLSGKKHQVITGMTIKTLKSQVNFAVSTDVYFKELAEEEIAYYVDNFKPYDKAGAYGIQEWIGFAGIEKIEGSFYNVMGLPVHRLYEELCKF